MSSGGEPLRPSRHAPSPRTPQRCSSEADAASRVHLNSRYSELRQRIESNVRALEATNQRQHSDQEGDLPGSRPPLGLPELDGRGASTWRAFEFHRPVGESAGGMELMVNACSLKEDLARLSARSLARSTLLSSLIHSQQEARQLLSSQRESQQQLISTQREAAQQLHPVGRASLPSMGSQLGSRGEYQLAAALADSRSFAGGASSSLADRGGGVGNISGGGGGGGWTPPTYWASVARLVEASASLGSGSNLPPAAWAAAAAAAAAELERARPGRMFDALTGQRLARPLSRQSMSDTDARTLDSHYAVERSSSQIADLLMNATTAIVSNKAEEPCCICLDPMELGRPVSMLRCMHRMHGPCLKKWLLGKTSTVCPLCKSSSKITRPADY